MNTKKSLAFIVELIGLFILLIMVIVIITQIFVMSRSESLKAKQLTEAVIAAENMAEAASSSQDLEDVTDIIEGSVMIGDSVYHEESGFVVKVSRDEEASNDYARDTIEVFAGSDMDTVSQGTEEPLYSLESGTFFGGEARP